MSTKHKHTEDPYGAVQRELDCAIAAVDPVVVAAACRRAQLELARVATSPSFDMRRSRAIASALRELSRDIKPDSGLPPLVTRGAR